MNVWFLHDWFCLDISRNSKPQLATGKKMGIVSATDYVETDFLKVDSPFVKPVFLLWPFHVKINSMKVGFL